MNKTILMILLFLPIILTAQNMKSYGVIAGHIYSIGDFEKNWSDGTSYYFSYDIIDSSNFALVFQTGFVAFNANRNTSYSGDLIFRIFPIQIGIKYFLIRNIISPYILAYSGINILQRRITYKGKERKFTKPNLNFQYGVGAEIFALKNVAFDFRTTYNAHIFNSTIPYNITGLEINLGVNFFFPR